jgi:hypothetical protein
MQKRFPNGTFATEDQTVRPKTNKNEYAHCKVQSDNTVGLYESSWECSRFAAL